MWRPGFSIPRPELRRLWVVEKWSVDEIARKYKLAPPLVERMLRDNGYYYAVDLEPFKDEIIDLYLNHKWQQGQLAEKFKCKKTEIHTLLQKYNINRGTKKKK